jgi:hypothetical protein
MIDRPVRCARRIALMIPLLLLLAGFTPAPRPLQQGVYAITVTAESFPPKFPAEARASLSGKWELTIMEGNKTKLTKDGELVVEGHYTSTTDRFVITDENGPLSCAKEPGKETGTYKLVVNENKLVLKAIDDKCDGRRFILTLLPWMKQG